MPLSRRVFLRVAALVAASAGKARAADKPQKVTQAAALYQPSPKGGQRCGICINFQPPRDCRFVQGPIVPQGWCQFFAGRENAG